MENKNKTLIDDMIKYIFDCGYGEEASYISVKLDIPNKELSATTSFIGNKDIHSITFIKFIGDENKEE